MNEYSDMVKSLVKFGASNSEISLKLGSLGMSVDQSTIARWVKTKNPGDKMYENVAAALKLLSESRSAFEKFRTLSDIQVFLASVFALKTVESLRGVAEFDLITMIQELQSEGVKNLTVFQLLEAITYAVTAFDISPKRIAKYLRLQQG
jgi:hypothetical protein